MLHRLARLLWLALLVVIAASGCGDDDVSPDPIDSAASCQALIDLVDFDAIDADDAGLVADKMWAIANEQVADDGIIDEKFPCSTIIRLLDNRFPEAVANLDLEELEDGS